MIWTGEDFVHFLEADQEETRLASIVQHSIYGQRPGNLFMLAAGTHSRKKTRFFIYAYKSQLLYRLNCRYGVIELNKNSLLQEKLFYVIEYNLYTHYHLGEHLYVSLS